MGLVKWKQIEPKYTVTSELVNIFSPVPIPPRAKRIYKNKSLSGKIKKPGGKAWIYDFSNAKLQLKFQLKQCNVKGGIKINVYRMKKKGLASNTPSFSVKDLTKVKAVYLKKKGAKKSVRLLKNYWYFGEIISKKKNRTGSYTVVYTKK